MKLSVALLFASLYISICQAFVVMPVALAVAGAATYAINVRKCKKIVTDTDCNALKYCLFDIEKSACRIVGTSDTAVKTKQRCGRKSTEETCLMDKEVLYISIKHLHRQRLCQWKDGSCIGSL